MKIQILAGLSASISLVAVSAFASQLNGPVYFESTHSKLPLGCRAEINRVVAHSCPGEVNSFAVTKEYDMRVVGYNYGECEAHFVSGFVDLKWDGSTEDANNFTIAGMDCNFVEKWVN